MWKKGLKGIALSLYLVPSEAHRQTPRAMEQQARHACSFQCGLIQGAVLASLRQDEQLELVLKAVHLLGSPDDRLVYM